MIDFEPGIQLELAVPAFPSLPRRHELLFCFAHGSFDFLTRTGEAGRLEFLFLRSQMVDG
jgi:hypothetical protein